MSRARPSRDVQTTKMTPLLLRTPQTVRMSAPTVSVVMPTHNRSALAVKAIDAILSQRGLLELIVVNDASTDSTSAVLGAYDDNRLRVIRLRTNSGRTKARQTGVDAAVGDVILLLDDDVIAADGLVEGHAAHHAAAEERVVVGYMPVGEESKVGRHGYLSVLYANEYEAACTRYEKDNAHVLKGLWGGNVSLKRDRCLEVGLVSSGFESSYHEDTDFGLRCEARGLVGLFDRNLRAEHYHQLDCKSFAEQAKERGAALRLLERRHDGLALEPAGMPGSLCRQPVIAATAASLAVVERVSGRLAIPMARLVRRINHQAGRNSS